MRYHSKRYEKEGIWLVSSFLLVSLAISSSIFKNATNRGVKRMKKQDLKESIIELDDLEKAERLLRKTNQLLKLNNEYKLKLELYHNQSIYDLLNCILIAFKEVLENKINKIMISRESMFINDNQKEVQ